MDAFYLSKNHNIINRSWMSIFIFTNLEEYFVSETKCLIKLYMNKLLKLQIHDYYNPIKFNQTNKYQYSIYLYIDLLLDLSSNKKFQTESYENSENFNQDKRFLFRQIEEY